MYSLLWLQGCSVNHALANGAMEWYKLYTSQQEIHHTIHIVVSFCFQVEKKRYIKGLKETGWLPDLQLWKLFVGS